MTKDLPFPLDKGIDELASAPNKLGPFEYNEKELKNVQPVNTI